jgi:hypothetical protein
VVRAGNNYGSWVSDNNAETMSVRQDAKINRECVACKASDRQYMYYTCVPRAGASARWDTLVADASKAR